jgi:hypothetical protein
MMEVRARCSESTSWKVVSWKASLLQDSPKHTSLLISGYGPDIRVELLTLKMSWNIALVLLFSFFRLTCSLRLNPRSLNSTLLNCYDYIIVGGGISGLVVANRLTEDPNGAFTFPSPMAQALILSSDSPGPRSW